ncbi:MAG: hypothetical protein CMJ42_16660 [Phyllobacteriaceae bacterium]|nr:hypothetical protein [Phyllobacteriaceae bacterium]
MKNQKDHKPLAERIATTIRQFVFTMPLHLEAIEFLKTHKPWKGLLRHRWAAIVVGVLAILIGIELVRTVSEIIQNMQQSLGDESVNQAGLLGVIDLSRFDWVLHGGKKYLVLIILEIFTFHFIRQTLEKRIGLKSEHTFRAFLHAEQRMMIVSLQAWILESIVRGLVNIPLGLFGLSFMKEGVGLLIQFYFLGYALVDNYLECFEYKVREAERITRTVAGVAIAVGAVAYFLMFIPVIGIVLATMIGAVTATIAMEKLAPEMPMPKAAAEELV